MPSPTAAMLARGGVTTTPATNTNQRHRLGDVRIDSFFQYAINFAYVTGIEALTGTIPIQSDAHFLCTETMYDLALTAVPVYALATIAVTPQLGSGGFLVQLTDGGTQRAMQNIAIPASALFGSAQRPFVWPFQHVFKANTSIGILSTGVSAAQNALTTVRYVFTGFKIPIGTAPAWGL